MVKSNNWYVRLTPLKHYKSSALTLHLCVAACKQLPDYSAQVGAANTRRDNSAVGTTSCSTQSKTVCILSSISVVTKLAGDDEIIKELIHRIATLQLGLQRRRRALNGLDTDIRQQQEFAHQTIQQCLRCKSAQDLKRQHGVHAPGCCHGRKKLEFASSSDPA